MRQVTWNKLATEDYYQNIDYLLEAWTEKEVWNFIVEVSKTIFILRQGIVDYPKTNSPNIRRCVIREQITLFYRIVDEEHIELLRFWNNYRDDKMLNF